MNGTSRVGYFEMDMSQTMLSVNQIGVFFNLKYLLTVLIYDVDFLDAGRH